MDVQLKSFDQSKNNLICKDYERTSCPGYAVIVFSKILYVNTCIDEKRHAM